MKQTRYSFSGDIYKAGNCFYHCKGPNKITELDKESIEIIRKVNSMMFFDLIEYFCRELNISTQESLGLLDELLGEKLISKEIDSDKKFLILSDNYIADYSFDLDCVYKKIDYSSIDEEFSEHNHNYIVLIMTDLCLDFLDSVFKLRKKYTKNLILAFQQEASLIICPIIDSLGNSVSLFDIKEFFYLQQTNTVRNYSMYADVMMNSYRISTSTEVSMFSKLAVSLIENELYKYSLGKSNLLRNYLTYDYYSNEMKLKKYRGV